MGFEEYKMHDNFSNSKYIRIVNSKDNIGDILEGMLCLLFCSLILDTEERSVTY
jgi:hypothetical protein